MSSKISHGSGHDRRQHIALAVNDGDWRNDRSFSSRTYRKCVSIDYELRLQLRADWLVIVGINANLKNLYLAAGQKHFHLTCVFEMIARWNRVGGR